MAGKSPGTHWKHRRTHQHSAEPSAFSLTIDTIDDSVSPPILPHAPDGSQEAYETETLIKSSTRIQPYASRKLKQHSSAVDLTQSPELVSLRGEGQPSDKLTSSESSNVKHDSDARKQKKFNEPKEAAKNQSDTWSAYQRYKSTASSMPDYGPSHPVSSKQGRSMPQYHGGIKPVNRLGNSNNKVAESRKRKTFDLVGNSKQSLQYSSRLQKIEDTSISSNASSRDVIEVDSKPQKTYEGPNTTTSAARSVHSQTPSGRRIAVLGADVAGVEEFRTVEKVIKPRQGRRKDRRHSSLESQISNSTALNVFVNEGTDSKASIVRRGLGLEDPRDPIFDPELAEKATKATKATKAEQYLPRVEISVKNPESLGYQGSSFLKPARNNTNSRLTRGSTTCLQTGESSAYFTKSQNIRQRRDSVNGADQLESSLLPRQQTSTLVKRTRAPPSTSRQVIDDLDEISAAHYGPNLEGEDELEVGSKLLLGYRNRQCRSDSMSVKTATFASAKASDSSDEDDSNKRGDMIHTDFKSNKTRGKKPPDTDTYEVRQVFSQSTKWLIDGGKNPWQLVHDQKTDTLHISDTVDQTRLAPKGRSVEKLEYNEKSSKIVIHKSRDSTVGGATHIYLDFKTADQSNALVEVLKAIHSTIGLIPKEPEYLSKVFRNNIIKLDRSTPARPQRDVEPLDIQLAKANSSRRQIDIFNKAQDAKHHEVNGNGTENEEISRFSRPKRLSSSMKSESNLDAVDGHRPAKRQRRPQALDLPSEKFYRASEQAHVNSHGTRASKRTAATQPEPRSLAKERSPSPERWTRSNPEWESDWHSSIIYPPTGKNKATVDKGDIERLDEGAFLNDNLIMFYLCWLESNLIKRDPKLADRIYFQNTFFYERLIKPGRGGRGINYKAVERWTAKVDLFKKDFIIVPVNENTHWYVAIIYNAPKLLNPDHAEDDPHSQSDKGTAADQELGVNTPVKSSSTSQSPHSKLIPTTEEGVKMLFHVAEGKEPQQIDVHNRFAARSASEENLALDSDNEGEENCSPDLKEAISDKPKRSIKKPNLARKGKRKSLTLPRKYSLRDPRIITLDSLGLQHSPTCSNLKEYLIAEAKSKKNIDIPLPASIGMTAKHVPQQTNLCDCGLFLLGYVEKFLEDPDKFVQNLLQNSTGKNMVWRDASEMRVQIRNILLDLQEQKIKQEVSETSNRKSKVNVLPKAGKRIKKSAQSTRHSDDQEAYKITQEMTDMPDMKETPQELPNNSRTKTDEDPQLGNIDKVDPKDEGNGTKIESHSNSGIFASIGKSVNDTAKAIKKWPMVLSTSQDRNVDPRRERSTILIGTVAVDDPDSGRSLSRGRQKRRSKSLEIDARERPWQGDPQRASLPREDTLQDYSEASFPQESLYGIIDLEKHTSIPNEIVPHPTEGRTKFVSNDVIYLDGDEEGDSIVPVPNLQQQSKVSLWNGAKLNNNDNNNDNNDMLLSSGGLEVDRNQAFGRLALRHDSSRPTTSSPLGSPMSTSAHEVFGFQLHSTQSPAGGREDGKSAPSSSLSDHKQIDLKHKAPQLEHKRKHLEDYGSERSPKYHKPNDRHRDPSDSAVIGRHAIKHAFQG